MASEADGIIAIVLRFRDKGDNIFDTIEKHKEIINNAKIDKDKYVWWGWWAKEYEHTPVEYFKVIEEKINKKPDSVKVFLLHTKKKTLYEAKCTSILFDENDNPLSSPEIDKTPEYYNNQKQKLWLKFNEIKEKEIETILSGKYSFLPDSKLFLKGIENNRLYASFANCKVAEIDEFLIQKRTMWFLRKQKKSDNDSDLDEWRLFPGNFHKYPAQARQDAKKILVLSDLHFTKEKDGNNKYRHNFRIADSNVNEGNLSLIEAIESIMQKITNDTNDEFKQIAGIIITGDFVFIPNKEEFSLAKKFIMELLERSGLKPKQLVIVPGNHDIAYIKGAVSLPGEMPPEASQEAMREYNEFYESIYSIAPNEYLCSCRKIQLSDNLLIEMIGVNSCVLQQEEESFVQGYVGRKQWEKITNELNMKPNTPTYSYRILLMHHHLLSTSIYSEKPEKKKNYNILLDAGRVSNNIRKYRIKMVIHGHGHESGYDHSAPRTKIDGTDEKMTPSAYDVISMGSAGSSDLPSGERNMMGILDFSKFGIVRFEKYELPTTDREKAEFEKRSYKEAWEMPLFEKEDFGY